MLFRPAALLVLMILLAGCRPADSPPAPVTAQAEAPPALAPRQAAAEAIKQHLGYHDVLAYEFQGIWLECWLECEVDGELVASTPKARCSPQDYLDDGKAPDDPQHVKGWLTIWGMEDDQMQLTIRSQLYRPETDTTSYAWQSTYELKIPPGESQSRFKSGVPYDAGWTRPLELPEVGQEFVIQSWHWEEQATASGPTERRVKVSLKGRQLTGAE